MRLYVKVDGKPAIIVGYGPGKNTPVAIVMGLAVHPVAVPLEQCIFPRLPKKLERKLRSWAKRETQDALKEVVDAGGGFA